MRRVHGASLQVLEPSGGLKIDLKAYAKGFQPPKTSKNPGVFDGFWGAFGNRLLR